MNNEQLYRKATLRYIGGAFLAVVMTLFVYWAAVLGWFDDPAKLALCALILAAAQLVVQVATFFHLGEEAKPRWKTYSFLFTILTALIIVIGSVWIMINLNYNMGMSAEKMNEYMMQQNKKGF